MLEAVRNLLNSKTGSVIKLLISLGILFFFFFTVDYKKLTLIASRLNYTYAILMLVLILAGNFIAAVRFRLLISVKKTIGIFDLMKQYFIGSFFNNFLPTAIGGDAVRMYLVSQFGIPKTTAAFFIIVERLIGFYSLICIAFLSSFFWGVPRFMSIFVTALLLSCSLVMWAIFSPRINRLFKKFKLRIFDNVTGDINLLRSGRAILSTTFILSICYQLVSISISYCVAMAINLHIPIISFLTLVPLVWIVTMIPVSFGGLGLRELSFIYLLAQINIPKEGALIVSLGTYCALITSGIIGMFFFLGGRLKHMAALETNHTEVL